MNFVTGIDNSAMSADAAQSREILHSIGKTAVQEGQTIDNTMKNIGRTIAGVFTVQQASNFIRSVISVRGEVESLQKSFEILAGKKGIPLFEEIRSFAVNTPMMMNDLAKGAQMLLSFNVAAEEVMPILRSIGDISMGDAQKFNSLTLAFSQMSSTGKLMGQDLLQMINAGFNPLAVISEQTGKSIGKLKEEMSAGAVSADMIKQAFIDATSEGGKFYNMLEIQSKGIKGSISNLQGAVDDMMNSIGENAQGIITESIQAATNLVKNYEEVGRVIAELIAIYGTYRAALIATNAVKYLVTQTTKGYTLAEIAHYNALVLVEKAQKLLNKTMLANPYALAAAAVTALAYGLYKYFEVENQSKKATEDHATAIKNLNEKYADEANHINTLIDTIRSETTARVERIAAMNELKGMYPAIFDKYIDEKGHISDLIGLQRELNEAQSQKRMQDDDDTLTKYRSYLQDYKQLQTAQKNGWSWATAGTSNNVALLTDDLSFWQSKDSFLKEKVAYWEQMVAQQQAVVDENNYTRFVDSLAAKTDDELAALKKSYEAMENLSEAEGKRLEAITAEISARTPKEVTKDKAYWEDYKKKQQGLLDAMTEAQLQTAEAEKIRKNIADAQTKIDAYSVTKGKAQDKQENSVAVQAAERTQRIKDYEAEAAREARQAELDIEQARIDGMNEGTDKAIAQNELNYKRLMEANRQREEEMVERLRDVKELEWQNANPKAKEQGLSFDRTSITAADLSDSEKEIIKEYASIAEEYRQKANKDSLEKMLSDVMTYEQQRAKIEEDYARRKESLYTTDKDGKKVLREGVTQGNVDELNRQEDEAYKAIDEQFAQREASYQAWCDEIASLSLQQLTAVLEQAEEELAKLKKSGTADSKQIAVARAKVATAKTKVQKANAQNDVAPNKRSVKEWEDLYKVLNECNSSFEEIGDTVGGVAGEIISSAGGIMTSTLSMINGIVQLVNMSSTGMQATAAAGATAISTLEKASVILTIISAAMQIAMQIVNLFNTDDDKQEEIDALQKRVEQLQWELDNADAVRLQERSFKAMEMLRNVTAEVQLEMFKLKVASNDAWGAISVMYSSVGNNEELLRQSADRVAKAYANIAYTADKALGGAKYDNAKEQLNSIAKQQLLLQEEANLEASKKKSDQGKVEDLERQIQELGEKAVTIINEMVEEIIGGTSSEIANELADAFFEAFEAGEDAAEAWGAKVNEIVADVLKRMLVSKFLEEPLGDIFDKYKAKWFKDGQFAGLDAVINSMNGFASDLNAVGEDFAAIWDSLPDSVKGMFTVTDAAREASQKGIATASQESVDELNGRATAIQGHTYSISENTKQLVAHSAAILESVLNIEMHTENISRRLERVEDGISDVRDTVNDMAIKGIKVK